MGHLLESFGLVRGPGGLFEFTEQAHHRFQLALFPLARDVRGDLPHILFGLEELPSLPGTEHFVHQVPIDQGTQVHVRVAPADVELLHHILGAQRLRADQEESVHLGHAAVDAPLATESAPCLDELGLCFWQIHGSNV